MNRVTVDETASMFFGLFFPSTYLSFIRDRHDGQRRRIKEIRKRIFDHIHLLFISHSLRLILDSSSLFLFTSRYICWSWQTNRGMPLRNPTPMLRFDRTARDEYHSIDLLFSHRQDFGWASAVANHQLNRRTMVERKAQARIILSSARHFQNHQQSANGMAAVMDRTIPTVSATTMKIRTRTTEVALDHVTMVVAEVASDPAEVAVASHHAAVVVVSEEVWDLRRRLLTCKTLYCIDRGGRSEFGRGGGGGGGFRSGNDGDSRGKLFTDREVP